MSHIDSGSSLRTKSAYYDEELARVRTQIHQLFDLQISLLCRRNEDCSPIYTLPLDVLITIFLMTCTYKRDSWETFSVPNPHVRIVSSVSSHWRQVVLQTPSIWRTVTLVAKGHTPDSEVVANWLHHHFDHADNLDLSLDFLLPTGHLSLRKHAHWKYQPISDVLFAPRNAHNVTTLHIENLPVEWLANLSVLPRLHTLVLKHLQHELDTPVTLDFRTQPLRRLSLNLNCDEGETRWGSIHLPSSIEELQTFSITITALSVCLHQCPNLIKYVHWDILGFTNSHLTTPLTLSHLETLSLPTGDFLNPTSVQNLFLPALKHLHISDYCSGDPPMPVITFCHHFSETLKSLELHVHSDETWGAGDFRQLVLHKLEHLEMLTLTNWSLPEILMVVQVLTPSDEELRCKEIKLSLPSLSSLVLICSHWDYITHYNDLVHGSELARVSNRLLPLFPRCSNGPAGYVLDQFLLFLEKRRAGERTRFQLDLPKLWSRKLTIWTEEFQDKFRHAVEGRHIEVLQDGRVLDWLQ